VSEKRWLAAPVALALAVGTLVSASAFAESRPANETRVRRDASGAVRRERAVTAGPSRRGDETSNRATASDRTRRSDSSMEVRGSRPTTRVENREEAAPRRGVVPRAAAAPRAATAPAASLDRRGSGSRGDSGRRVEGRGDDRRGNDRRGNDGYRGRGDDRDRHSGNRGNDRYNGRNDSRGGSYRSGRQPYYAHGRVSRVHRYGNGYRVWIGGAPYPFFVPMTHWHHDRFRVGLMIRLGGYYNDHGYYDYYDGRSTGELRGVVESVDYRRNTFVVNNEATGSFVTVAARDFEADRVRAGDFVELYGDWSRAGLFQARDVDVLDSYRR
jgi:hypothetical protein